MAAPKPDPWRSRWLEVWGGKGKWFSQLRELTFDLPIHLVHKKLGKTRHRDFGGLGQQHIYQEPPPQGLEELMT